MKCICYEHEQRPGVTYTSPLSALMNLMKDHSEQRLPILICSSNPAEELSDIIAFISITRIADLPVGEMVVVSRHLSRSWMSDLSSYGVSRFTLEYDESAPAEKAITSAKDILRGLTILTISATPLLF